MKIEKYKFLGNGRYQIVIDGVKYIIYEDIILKYNILSKNIITKNDLDNYLKDNHHTIFLPYHNSDDIFRQVPLLLLL